MAKYKNYPVEVFGDLREMLRTNAEKYPNKAALMQKRKNKWQGISYRRLFANVNALGTELLSRELEGKNILIIGENGVLWATAYLAVVCGVGTAVPLDKDTDAEALARVAAFCDAGAVIYSPYLEDRVWALPENVKRISMGELSGMIARGRKRLAGGYRTYLDAELKANEGCTVLFTAGSTGAPKGVVLSHRNLCHSVAELRRMVYLDANDLFLSVLPLHHAYECVGGFLTPLSCGATVAYPADLGTVSDCMREIRPSVILTVPVLLESMYRKILIQVRQNGLEKKVGDLIKTTNAIPSRSLRFSSKKKAFAAIHASFGGHLRLLLTIGDSVNPAVLAGFGDLGITALQAYGLTECAALGAINRDTYAHLPAAGLATPNILIDVADMQENGIGEVRIKGENVMLGYYKMPKATERVLRNGWLYTGDLGRLDKNGFLHITGNKKNEILLTEGVTVFPEELELLLTRTPYVKEALVVGARRSDGRGLCPVARLYPDYARLKEDFGEHYSSERVEAELRRAVANVNAQQPSAKQIADFEIRRTPFPKSLTGKLYRK